MPKISYCGKSAEEKFIPLNGLSKELKRIKASKRFRAVLLEHPATTIKETHWGSFPTFTVSPRQSRNTLGSYYRGQSKIVLYPTTKIVNGKTVVGFLQSTIIHELAHHTAFKRKAGTNWFDKAHGAGFNTAYLELTKAIAGVQAYKQLKTEMAELNLKMVNAGGKRVKVRAVKVAPSKVLAVA